MKTKKRRRTAEVADGPLDADRMPLCDCCICGEPIWTVDDSTYYLETDDGNFTTNPNEIIALGRDLDGLAAHEECIPFVAPEDRSVKEFTGTVNVCCHYVDFSYEIDPPRVLAEDDREQLTEAAEERAKECIIEGCHMGELCWCDGLGDETIEHRGWFCFDLWRSLGYSYKTAELVDVLRSRASKLKAEEEDYLSGCRKNAPSARSTRVHIAKLEAIIVSA